MVGEEFLTGGCGDHVNIGSISNHCYSRNHRNSSKHWSMGQTILPEEGPGGRIERLQAAFTTNTVDGRVATSHVEPRPIPSTGRDAALSIRRATPSHGYLHLPYGPTTDCSLVK